MGKSGSDDASVLQVVLVLAGGLAVLLYLTGRLPQVDALLKQGREHVREASRPDTAQGFRKIPGPLKKGDDLDHDDRRELNDLLDKVGN